MVKMLFALLAAALPFITCQVLPGGQTPYSADIHNQFVVFAVSGINTWYQSNGDNRERVSERVVSATSQIVAGVLYRFEIQVSGGDQQELCSVSVLSSPWLEPASATKLVGSPVCEAQQSRRQVGSAVAVDISDPDTLRAFRFLETTITAQENSVAYLVGVQFEGITKQVVNGIIFTFNKVSYARSVCPPNEILTNNYLFCVNSAIGLPVVKKCTSSVYWNPRDSEEYTLKSNLCFTDF
jgi:uncharacterized protein with beta-barrel porin domain